MLALRRWVLLLAIPLALLILTPPAEQHITSPWLNDTGVILLALLLVWLLCNCGLHQQPGFRAVSGPGVNFVQTGRTCINILIIKPKESKGALAIL
ncbi:hypothetical protein WG68_15990 [Arsukibacterium ikkense]|uniref:Uncharacterized protein n=1 Tax=Arsukibacterium ikkense TaxID=336831 RepID=A0A0M2V598_9GAMM|nr:hypothetical protein [Arsukibacterium ikkense]KKO44328.1 hypothetical protein WG68_15990 [Arsukibacterium ikkense]